MFEEVTVQAAQTLITLFWIFLAFIFITAVAYSRTEKTKHSRD